MYPIFNVEICQSRLVFIRVDLERSVELEIERRGVCTHPAGTEQILADL